MHLQFNSLRDYADGLNLITFVIFLLQVIEFCKGALYKKTGISLYAVIQECSFWTGCNHLIWKPQDVFRQKAMSAINYKVNVKT